MNINSVKRSVNGIFGIVIPKEIKRCKILYTYMLISGGGLYEKSGTEIKVGYWIEISDQYTNFF